jgi:hypothetical protein
MKKWFCVGGVALLGAAALGLAGCRENDHSAASRTAAKIPADTLAASPLPMREQQLGTTGFYLTLPSGFALKATNAADFLVYYFAPADTTVRADFTGGLYLGTQPQGDEPDSIAGCRTRRAATILLGHPATFSVRRCATGYAISSVFDSHSGRAWDAQANAFGEAKSAAGLRQLLAVFATLRHQPAH